MNKFFKFLSQLDVEPFVFFYVLNDITNDSNVTWSDFGNDQHITVST